MLNYFNSIREKVLSKGELVSEGAWKLESCHLIIHNGVERITAIGLVDAVREGNSVKILKGSEDSLKFLAESI